MSNDLLKQLEAKINEAIETIEFSRMEITDLKEKNDVNWQNYTRHNNRLTRAKEQAQDYHHSNDFRKHSGDPKMTWKKINELLNKKRDHDKLPKRLKYKHGITEDPITIANE